MGMNMKMPPGGVSRYHFNGEDKDRIKEAVKGRFAAIVGPSAKAVLSLDYRTTTSLGDMFFREMTGDRLRRVLTGTPEGRRRWSEFLRPAVEAWRTNLPPVRIKWRDHVPPIMTEKERREYEEHPEPVVVWYPRPGAEKPRITGSLRDRRAISLWTTRMAWSYVMIPIPMAAWIVADLVVSEYRIMMNAEERKAFEAVLIKVFQRNPVDEIFRKAEEGRRILRDLSKIEVVSDPNGGVDEAIRIMESAIGRAIIFRQGEERTTGELGEAFRPGTIMGDLLLLGLCDTPDDQREEVCRRFMSGRRPVHEGRLFGYPEIKRRRGRCTQSPSSLLLRCSVDGRIVNPPGR
jgi:hypothetical protein